MTTDPMESSEPTGASASSSEASSEESEPIAEMAAHPPSGNGAKAGEERPFVGQLQHMIDNLAHVATPVLREVAAKAAELAAKAGEAAGPIAHKAADVTGDVGHRVAMKSREVAADLRRVADPDKPAAEPSIAPGEAPAEDDEGHGL